MKLMMLAALAIATPVAAFAQTTPAPADPAMAQPAPGADATQTTPAPADPAAAAPADPAAAAPADPAAAAPAAPMAGAPQMGAATSNPAPAAQDSYPVCSATVHDQCREGAGGKHMGGKHKMAHRKHK
jgi:hypothetical protein